MRATIGRVAAATMGILAFGSAALYAAETVVQPAQSQTVVAELSDHQAAQTADRERTTQSVIAEEASEERTIRMVGPSFFPDE